MSPTLPVPSKVSPLLACFCGTFFFTSSLDSQAALFVCLPFARDYEPLHYSVSTSYKQGAFKVNCHFLLYSYPPPQFMFTYLPVVKILDLITFKVIKGVCVAL